jgi:hypothetical protein
VKSRAVVAAAVMCVCGASCGGTAEGLYPVRGKVLMGGEPASGAVVVFQKEGAAGGGDGEPLVPTAVCGPDGSFALESAGKGPGAPAGTYKVLVTWRTGPAGSAPPAGKAGRKANREKPDKSESLPPDRLKGRYSNPGKPLIRGVEIKPQSNDLPPFELKG